VATHVFFPLLSAVAKINLGEFIQRLDALVVFTLITGGFFKIAVFLYVSVKIAQDVFSVKEERSLLMPLGIVILFASVAVASNFVEHVNEGLNIVPHFVHIPFQLVIPVFFTIVYLIRKKSIKKKLSSGSSTLT
jgi:spore germination protein KB